MNRNANITNNYGCCEMIIKMYQYFIKKCIEVEKGLEIFDQIPPNRSVKTLSILRN